MRPDRPSRGAIRSRPACRVRSRGGPTGSSARASSRRSCALWLRSHDPPHGGREARPLGVLLLEALPSRCGETVELRTPITVRGFPLRFDPPLHLETLERRIQGSKFDDQCLAGSIAECLRNAVAVQGSAFQRSEHQHLEQPVQRFHMKKLYIKSICISTEWR